MTFIGVIAADLSYQSTEFGTAKCLAIPVDGYQVSLRLVASRSGEKTAADALDDDLKEGCHTDRT